MIYLVLEGDGPLSECKVVNTTRTHSEAQTYVSIAIKEANTKNQDKTYQILADYRYESLLDRNSVEKL